MDILSDVLRTVRFSGALDLRPEFSAPWTVKTESCHEFAEVVEFGTKQIVQFHIIAEGHCWVQTTQGICQALVPGDVVIFPHGDSHIMGDRLDRTPASMTEILRDLPWEPPTFLAYGGGGDVTRIVCGFLECEELLAHPFLKSLPPFMHVRTFVEPSVPLLEVGVQRIIQEADCSQPGSLCLLTRLIELMFIEILRSQLQSQATDPSSSLAALTDPIVGQILELFHGNPAHPWTVPELASHLNLSRTTLAQRFRQLLGQPPIQYLTQWRLQLASQQLRNTDAGIAKIAAEVGYESEAAFSRAFKRYVGVPPGTWRNHKLA
ncbi:cupin domain-containing protein [Acaryochloris marina NIES-2412]|uniref:cupin domain-containing protein n=1 Tax=Acaryochloris marina TaxID=155978 RepID=UPI00405850D4